MKIFGPALLFCIIVTSSVNANELRNITKRDGLSNSSILSMCQDNKGRVWFGTVDGLNCYDGALVREYKPTNESNALSGNLIESIVYTSANHMWIQTNYGINCLDENMQIIHRYDNHCSNTRLKTHPNIEVYFISLQGQLVYLDEKSNQLNEIQIHEVKLEYSKIATYVIDIHNTFWIVMNDGTIHKWKIKFGSEMYLSDYKKLQHAHNIIFANADDNRIQFIDNTLNLYEYNLIEDTKYYRYKFNRNTIEGEQVTSIIKHDEDYFISLNPSGLIILHRNPENQHGYICEEADPQVGIFCLMNDKNQDIVWIGSDGNGVYAYFKSQYTIKSVLSSINFKNIIMPIRTLLLDDEKSLWIGTKGNGIVRVKDYNPNKSLLHLETEYFTTANSSLNSNSVFSTESSRRGVLWIGTERGLNYYSYKNKIINNLHVPMLEGGLEHIYGICEMSDSTLVLATVGTGVVKLSLRWVDERPMVTEAHRTLYGSGGYSENYFFGIHKNSDSEVVLGNRGYGIFMFDTKDNNLSRISPENITKNKTINDIFCIEKDTFENTWFGTSYGILKMTKDGIFSTVNHEYNMPASTVHGIISDKSNNLWLSTNSGIIKFNTQTNSVTRLNQSRFEQINEFSDGAYFSLSDDSLVLFGGVNGFVSIKQEQYQGQSYTPNITIDQLKIFGQSCNTNDYLSVSKQDGGQQLSVNHNDNFFSVSFYAIDFMNGENYSYMYMLEGLNDNWVNNGNSNVLHFTDISVGKYTLMVKYKNNQTGLEGPIFSIKLIIRPAWYATVIAKLCYLLLAILICVLSVYYIQYRISIRRKHMLDKLSQEHQKQIYESKLSFVTNIAHEFCTPLTLISGPCERIMSSEHDVKTARYVEIIKRNADKMNLLIHQLIEFRRIDTGNKQINIQRIDVAQQLNIIANDFNILAEERQIEYIKNIPFSLRWISDGSAISTIATNLISNAFKYSEKKGCVRVELECDGDTLKLSVTNTGKGIKQEDMKLIFDKYTILDRLENYGEKPISRNGLGLAISSELAKMLNGKIEVRSKENKDTTFTAIIPNAMASEIIEVEELIPPQIQISKSDFVSTDIKEQEFDKSKPTIMVIDDDKETLWFISDIFHKQYNVIQVNDSRCVEQIIAENHPNIIISDVMMPHLNGIDIVKYIKSDPKTSHIPIILVSAAHQMDDQIKGLNAGADMYITKPFDVDYLSTFVNQLLSQKIKLKEYLSSPNAAYELTAGEFVHIEHKKFIQQVINIISNNIDNPKLNSKFIADQLCMGLRHFYRRVEETGAQKPSTMIKECKLHITKDLLINSSLTIEEISIKSHFASKTAFFRSFSKKFGCTPKELRDNGIENILKSKM